MSFLVRWRLSRDPHVTVANLLDELLRQKGDCDVAMTEAGAYRLSDFHADVCAKDAFLRTTIGIKPGQPIAIYRTNDRDCFHWFLAIIRAGGIAVPLNPMLSFAELERILESSGTQAVITDTPSFERTIQNRHRLSVQTWIQGDTAESDLEGFLRPTQVATSFAPVTIDPSTTVAIFHTSGTSGFPKGAALSSNALLGGRASTVLTSMLLGHRDLALIALPWSHIMAVSIALYGLMAGIRGCFLVRFDVEEALRAIERYHVTAFVGVPAMFVRLVNSHPEASRLQSVRVWLSASDHLPAETRERLRNFGAFLRFPGSKRIPPVLLNGYGMVELGGLAMMGIDLSFLPGSGNVCVPVPPFRIRVANEEGQTVPTGVTGECQIKRRGLSPHYWNDKANDSGLLTPDGWLRTGDLATRNRLGLIRLVGRMKDVIKSGGYSVYVRELEECLSAYPAVMRAVAFGIPHPEKGESPAAAVELRPGSQASEQDLLEWCKHNLAAYKAPRRIWILEPESLPQNHNGKMLRQVLRERLLKEL